jgi:hypothetical protein
MKYKFDISSKPNRLAFVLGVSIVIGVICGKITERKICTFSAGGHYDIKSVEVKCGESYEPRFEIITYNYNTTYAVVSGALTFGLFLVLNGFVKVNE